jgi:hypothetical protein
MEAEHISVPKVCVSFHRLPFLLATFQTKPELDFDVM